MGEREPALGGSGRGARSLFFVEYAMGHRTHTRFLEQYLAGDRRFAATVVRLPRARLLDGLGQLLTGVPRPPLRLPRLDAGVWWQMQYRRRQVNRWLRGQGVERAGLELVYVHTQTAAGAILDLPRRVPAVVSIDLTWRLAFREDRFVRSPFLEPICELERRIYERSDAIVAFSEWAAASVVEEYGIPARKVSVVRNGVTLPAANGPNGHGANGHGPNGHGTVNGNGNGNGNGHGPLRIGFVGNQFARKGGDLLLRVHQQRFAEAAHLTIVSNDGPTPGRWRNVSVRSDVPWEELMTAVVPGFDVFAFPTRYDYSPYAVIEAMAAGVPVVASRVGAIPEMIEDGVDGFLIEPAGEAALAERVAWALEHRASLPAMGERARRRAAAGYAAGRTYPALLDLLAGVAG